MGSLSAIAGVVFAIGLAAAGGCLDTEVSRQLGARCEVKDDCGERCLAPGASFPDGFCTVSCMSDDDCPGASLCVQAEGGVCLFGCRIDEGCAFLGDGWTCEPESAGSGIEVMVCIGQQ